MFPSISGPTGYLAIGNQGVASEAEQSNCQMRPVINGVHGTRAWPLGMRKFRPPEPGQTYGGGVSDSVSLRLDLIPFTIGIVLVSISTSMAVVLIRRASSDQSDEVDLAVTTRLTLVVVLGLVGTVFLFLGLFE